MTEVRPDRGKAGLTLILNGGWTAEAAVSRATGKTCLDAAREAGWQAEMIECSRRIITDLANRRPVRVFNALHGQFGEDGTIQGILNGLQIPYTHSGLLASAIAMDKPMAKKLLGSQGITCPQDLMLHHDPDTDSLIVEYDDTVCIKPCNDGSSIGVRIISKRDADGRLVLPPLSAWPANTQLMAEPFIAGRELTVTVLDGTPLTVTEIIPPENGFYDYQAKYSEGGSRHMIPANLPPAIFRQCLEVAAQAHAVLGCRGVSRSDFRWDETSGILYLLEINTQPGMTATSLVPEQAAFCGISLPMLVSRLLETAQCD